MSKTTKIIGWVVLAITEILIIVSFLIDSELRGVIIGSQITVFTIVWASVAGKNIIDLKRDQLGGMNGN